MNPLNLALAELARDLNELGVQWALIGGFAVSTRAEPRTTRDIDVAIAVASDREAESLVADMQSRGYRLRDGGILEQEATGRLATARMNSSVRRSEFEIIVDLMFASSGIEPEIAQQSEILEVVDDVFLPVARIGHLMALKILAARPQDLADLDQLLRVAEAEDLELVEESARLIMDRGSHRGKDLVAALRLLIDQDNKAEGRTG